MQPVGFIRHQHGLVATLKKVAEAMVPAVHASGEGGIEPMHRAGQVRLGSAQEKVVMIGHQAKREKMKIEAFHRVPQQIEKKLSIRVSEKNRLPVVAAADDVVNRVRKLDAPGPGHGAMLAKGKRKIKN
jgi:hypothetical protein